MSAQRVATGLGLAGLIGLLVWVGLPALAPPPAVPVINIVEPTGARPEDADDNEQDPTGPATDGGDDDDAGDADDGDDDADGSGSDDDDGSGSDDDDGGSDDDGDDD
ncbi:hypothetical protein [Micromonospora sp. KC721]|uniref:hypothetical protein n=1 Tax=Micromonospora sp. KC721 TaxID=2530380 RepID=UPI001047CAC2|nr:hypothetical protein [Micromonospora sp. KC721]TDB82341.1 hypothetical protein E1182_01730 [Micromonospora sp. KC721]